MNRISRRSLLRNAVVAIPPIGPASARVGKFSAERLGIMCNLGPDESSARKVLAAARAAGYQRAQIRFPWTRVSAAYLKALPQWVKAEGLQADALGAYVNCCRPEVILTDCRAGDLPRAIEFAGTLGARRLVAWTGGYGTSLATPDPRNL